jgi:hypothetical protein
MKKDNLTAIEAVGLKTAAHEVLSELIILNGPQWALDVLRYWYVVSSLNAKERKGGRTRQSANSAFGVSQ